MAAANPTNRVEVLKRIWGNKINEPWIKRSRMAEMISKDTKFTNEGRYVIAGNSLTTGSGSTYSDAIANEGPSVDKRFFVTRRKEYASFKIDGELMAAGGDGVVDAFKEEANRCRVKFFRALSQRIWGNGGGSLGVVSGSANLATTTILLATPQDTIRFEVGDVIQFSDDDGTAVSPAGLRSSGASCIVTGVNFTAGTITVDVAPNTSVPAAATGDYIFRKGDYGNCATGLPGWQPTTAPSASESFFGVDRTTGNAIRNYGYIHAKGSSTLYEEVAVRAVSNGMNMGIDGNFVLFTNPVNFGEMALEAKSARRVNVENKEYGFSYSALVVHSAMGDLKIMSEPDCPVGRYWIKDPKDMHLRSAGECPKQLDGGGGKWLEKINGEDAYRAVLGAYLNFTVEDPFNSIQGAW